jgi:hemolysin activation/secretion protein
MRSAIWAAFLLWPASALAQTSTPIDRGRIDRDRPDTGERLPDATQAPPLPASTGRVDAEAVAVPIRSIRFEGTSVPAVVAAAAQDFVGQPADKPTLQRLVASMTLAYGRSPVALFTIVVPAQDLSTGDLRIAVGEGHVEAVILSGEVEGRPLTLVKSYADRITRERPTSRRTLERYLSLIRDIPGLKVDATLKTGSGPGGVRVILKLDYKRPTLTFGFDNRTTRLVDDGQFQANARAYGLLREGDFTELALATSIDARDYRYAGLSHSTPIGTDGMRLSLNAGYLETRPSDTPIRGEAKTLGLTLSYPLIRSYKRNLTLSSGVDGINSDNAALGSLIASERTRALRVAAGYGQSTGRLSLSGSASVSRGLSMLGARVDAILAETTFTKLNARFGIDRSLGKSIVARLRGSGQWTRDRLPAVERFSVGGPDFGRGFENALISADRGLAGLAEIAWRPAPKGAFRASELYGFADMAKVRILPRGAFTGANVDMGSAGGGVRFAWGEKARLELEAARPVNDPYPGYVRKWRFSIGWKLALRS